jgi:NitT/TauT family transport system ATP-binding protein
MTPVADSLRQSALSAQDVSLRYGKGGSSRTILQNVSLEVRSEEIVCVIGPSGCGKTTLLRLLAGLIAPSAGEVAFRGAPITRPRRELAVVFQDYTKALLPWRTVTENIALALESRRVPRHEHRRLIDPLLRQVGLDRHAEFFPAQLSGGLQQRLQIARCLAQQPSVLLMDEPFGALDAMTREVLQDEIMRLSAASRTTIFLSRMMSKRRSISVTV